MRVDFPAPFSPHQSVDLPLAQGEVHVVQRLDAGEQLRDVFHPQKFFLHSSTSVNGRAATAALPGIPHSGKLLCLSLLPTVGAVLADVVAVDDEGIDNDVVLNRLTLQNLKRGLCGFGTDGLGGTVRVRSMVPASIMAFASGLPSTP